MKKAFVLASRGARHVRGGCERAGQPDQFAARSLANFNCNKTITLAVSSPR